MDKTDTAKKLAIYIIRHAQSTFNTAAALATTDEALMTVRTNPEFMDAAITEKGIAQCEKAQAQVKDIDVGLVIVSPYRRALQTADIIFRNHPSNPKKKVLPILGERLHTVCDIPLIEERMTEFPDVDFGLLEELKNRRHLWYLYQLEGDAKDKLIRAIDERYKTDDEVVKGARDLMLEEFKKLLPGHLEDDVAIMKRTQKLKDMLKQEALKMEDGKKLVVVTHSALIERFTADGFGEHGEIIGGIFPENCQILEYEFK